MADIVSKEQRSKNMSAIRSKDTKPEIYLRKALFYKGYRYRKNANNIEGHPDIYLAKYNAAIFVHGCFWHRHPGCKFAYEPKSRIDFWNKKFESNKKRDVVVKKMLAERGIRVLIVWECTIKKMYKDSEYEQKILNGISRFLEVDTIIYSEL